MSQTIAEKLATLGYELPVASAPAANYVTTVRTGNLISISGQISRIDEATAVFGTVGASVTAEEGRRAAEISALNLLSQIAVVTGGTLAAVRRVVRLGVFIASTPDFNRHSEVANGASDLFVAVFGDAGRHTRTAVGVSALPVGVAVEVDALVELEEGF